MRLVDLLATTDHETLDRLSQHHLGASEGGSRANTCVNLEGVLRSPKHVRDTVYNLQPPTFCILQGLLETDALSLPLAGLRESVAEETRRLAERVTSGQILARDDGLRLYRRVLLEARRNDLELDASETALLGVLRRELKIRQVEHFLIEHHADLQQFWSVDHMFLDALNGLRSNGLMFVLDGQIHVPTDLANVLRQILGLEMSNAARRRVFERLSGQETASALADASIKSTGSRDEKIQRLIDNYIQPSHALTSIALASLRELCRATGLQVGGTKDELIDRVVDHFARGLDIRVAEPEPAPLLPEPRVLNAVAFDALFGSLRGQDLSDILSGIGANRVTGAKEYLVRLVQECRLNEMSLLMELDQRQLEALLSRHRLKSSGSKRERVQRILDWCASPAFERTLTPELAGTETNTEAPRLEATGSADADTTRSGASGV